MTDDAIEVKADGSAKDRPLETLPAGKPFTPGEVRRRSQHLDPASTPATSAPRNRPDSVITGGSDGRRSCIAAVSGVMLAFFIVAAALLSIAFFAATQFQGKLSEYQINGVPLTVWRLESILGKHRLIQGDLDLRTKSLRTTEDHFNERSFFLTQKEAELDEAQQLFRRTAEEVIAAASKLDPDLASRLPNGNPVDALSTLTSHPKIAANDEIGERLRLLQSVSQTIAVKQSETIQVKAAVRGLDARMAQERKAIEATTASLLSSLGVAPATPDAAAARERLENVLSELGSISDSRYWHETLIYHLARTPRELIVLALVLSMGVLGSALYMATRFEEDYQRLTWHGQILRPCAGAVTALVLFIVVKAGLLIVADTTQFAGNAPVNPFFISFLGIVAGLMSERVIQTVRTVGENLLQNGEEGPPDQVRWANCDLTSILTEARRSTEQLSSYLAPLTAEEVNEIMLGRKGASAQEQQIIAAFIQKQPREIFTDIKAAA